MHKLHPELTDAMSRMMDRIDAFMRESGFTGEPVKMYLAGGMAVHYHCGTRYTDDVDATFSERLMLPFEELVIDYMRETGKQSCIYFDTTYNDNFALLHPDHREACVEWECIGNEQRLIHLLVFCPLDLAVSKLSRFSPNDRADILALAQHRYFNSTQLKARAAEALDYYVGSTRWIHLNIEQISEEIDQLALAA